MKTIGKYLIKGLLAIFAALPLKAHYRLAGFLAWFISSVVRYRTDDVMINLSRSFPEKNYEELKAVRKQFYSHFAKVLTETIWLGGCRNPERLHKGHLVEIVNPGTIARLYETSPSVMILYGHCGNWEVYGGMESYNYTDIPTHIDESNYCVVYRKLSSPVWDDIMRDNRFAPVRDREHFDGYIESKRLVRYILTHKNEKKIYTVNTDQRPYFQAPDYMMVNFLHQECQTMSGAAALAHRLGFSVAYQSLKERPDGHGYLLEYVPICQDAGKMEVEEIMKRFYGLLEKDIIEQPHNYLWTHRRWARI